MVTHLMVALIGFGLFYFVQISMEGRPKLIASVVIVGLTLGGLIVDAPTDCKPASLAPAIAPDSAR